MASIGSQILLALRAIARCLNGLPGVIQVVIWLPWASFILGGIFKEILRNGRGG